LLNCTKINNTRRESINQNLINSYSDGNTTIAPLFENKNAMYRESLEPSNILNNKNSNNYLTINNEQLLCNNVFQEKIAKNLQHTTHMNNFSGMLSSHTIYNSKLRNESCNESKNTTVPSMNNIPINHYKKEYMYEYYLNPIDKNKKHSRNRKSFYSFNESLNYDPNVEDKMKLRNNFSHNNNCSNVNENNTLMRKPSEDLYTQYKGVTHEHKRLRSFSKGKNFNRVSRNLSNKSGIKKRYNSTSISSNASSTYNNDKMKKNHKKKKKEKKYKIEREEYTNISCKKSRRGCTDSPGNSSS
ncbi:hypothetical protein PMLGA01_080038900, partial [Plasmodium malariae]